MGQAQGLEEVLHTHKVLLDTCFAMDEGFPGFCETYRDSFKGNSILMPQTAKNELTKLARDADEGRRSAAKRAIQAVDKLASENLLEFRHEASDSFTDLVIQRVVEQYLLLHDFCVLTNDVGLMQDLHAKRHKRSVKGARAIVVIKLHGKTHEPVYFRPYRTGAPPTTPGGPQPFASASDVCHDAGVPLDIKQEVGAASVLHTSAGKTIKLDREIARGGEGVVFDVAGKADVCKVYHRDRLTKGRENKIELMCSRHLDRPGVCWPTDVLRDSDGVFRGFLMARARGHSLRETLFVPKEFLQDYPAWTRRESVGLALSILEAISHLHRLNVLIGDINELNILLVNEGEVYFVDCDSFQVQGYPCPVGTVNFTAPEIQGRDFSTFLRTKEHELFAVATLLFMILHPGKCPYSHQGGADGAANIREGHFPYPLGEENPTDGAPLGHWRFCWSHLPYGLKEAFYRSFDKDHLSANRIPLEEWVRLLKQYQLFLSDEAKVFVGPSRQPGFDLSILPENYRRIPGQVDAFPSLGKTDLDGLGTRLWLRDNTGRGATGQPRPGPRPVPRMPVPPPVGSGPTPAPPRMPWRPVSPGPSKPVQIDWRLVFKVGLAIGAVLALVYIVVAVVKVIITILTWVCVIVAVLFVLSVIGSMSGTRRR